MPLHYDRDNCANFFFLNVINTLKWAIIDLFSSEITSKLDLDYFFILHTSFHNLIKFHQVDKSSTPESSNNMSTSAETSLMDA